MKKKITITHNEIKEEVINRQKKEDIPLTLICLATNLLED